MKRIYQSTQVDNDLIYLEVKVGTVGVAYTIVQQVKSGGQKTILAESTAKSGNVARKQIGTNGGLRGSYVITQTIITLGSVITNDWETIIKNIYIAYIFEGGFTGKITYNYDVDDVTISDNGKVAVIIKPIEIE
jgi:hypothetical protein